MKFDANWVAFFVHVAQSHMISPNAATFGVVRGRDLVLTQAWKICRVPKTSHKTTRGSGSLPAPGVSHARRCACCCTSDACSPWCPESQRRLVWEKGADTSPLLVLHSDEQVGVDISPVFSCDPRQPHGFILRTPPCGHEFIAVHVEAFREHSCADRGLAS